MDKLSKEVSVIICTMNSESTIKDVLESVAASNPLEIIVVDGNSKDKTAEIAKKYTKKVIKDPGKGLGFARNMGLKETKGKYIFYVGSDNVVEPDCLPRLIQYLEKGKYAGVALLTKMRNVNNDYFIKGLDMRWRVRFYEGPREVIGTPYLFRKDVLEKYMYDDGMTWSDDADLGARLKKDNYKVAYSNVFCQEVGFDDFPSIKRRFLFYGLSDFEYYKKYSPEWKLPRKIRSWLHPFIAETCHPISRLKNPFKILYYLPFLLFATYYRYVGYIRNALKNRKQPKV